MGADTKANTLELVREAGGLLERLQRRVALETLCNRGSSFRTEIVVFETAGVGSEVRVAACQWALTQDLFGGSALQVANLRLLEHGSERGGALDSDLVITEAAQVYRVRVSLGLGLGLRLGLGLGLG